MIKFHFSERDSERERGVKGREREGMKGREREREKYIQEREFCRVIRFRFRMQ